MSGTSNAAALTSRLASQLYDVIESLPAERHVGKEGRGLLLKALLVHTAQWSEKAEDAIRQVVSGRGAKDAIAASLGYGAIDPERAFQCTGHRVTLLGHGVVGADETMVHRLPIPKGLHTFSSMRRLIITLAWFSPINPHHRKYRRAQLSFRPPLDDESPLRVKRSEMDGNTAKLGTIQHEILERSTGVINLPEEQEIEIPVSCIADAGGLSEPVPYSIAVTLEIQSGVLVPHDIYAEIRERIRPRVPISAR